MDFSHIIARTRQENQLFSALIELTYRCNLDCFLCYNDINLKGLPLSKEQYLRLLTDLRKLGTFNLIFSGGEPLANRDFFYLGAKAKEMGFAVRVKSNGYALCRTLAKRLKNEVAPFMIEISLHGACAETHDRQTRVPGSFDRLMDNVKVMQSLGLRLKFNSALTAWNEAEFEQMCCVAEDFGIPLQFDTQLTLRDDGNNSPLEITPSQEAIVALLKYQMPRRGSTQAKGPLKAPVKNPPQDGTDQKYCGAGASTIAVNPFGTVYPCVQWRRSIGSLHDKSLPEIWAKNQTLEEIRQANIKAGQRIRDLCPNVHIAGFCPGYAEMVSGDATQIYPVAMLRKELAERALDLM